VRTRRTVATIVLAAGNSTRLGSPKQLVVYQGMPLVARAAWAALEAGAGPVVVVLGADAETVGAPLAGVPITSVVNPEWSRGVGTSLATGIRAILGQAPSADALLVTLADQPLVDSAALGRLLAGWSSSDATIAAAEYADTIGVPAVFGRAHFDSLSSLPAAAGAARLLRQPGARVHRVPMPEAAVDIDTPGDLECLVSQTQE